MRIAIIAALPGELKHLVKHGWHRTPATHAQTRMWTASIAGSECLAVCSGMGAEAARRAFAQAETAGPIDIVLSAGWAGALRDSLAPGETYAASTVIDAQTGERFALAPRAGGHILVTTAHVARAEEKRRLAATYGGALVDMESATIARLAHMRGIPAVCLKAVSDGPAERLPDFNRFLAPTGQMRMPAFIAHALLHPGFWPALLRLGRASSRGSRTLASAILAFLQDAATKNTNVN